MKKLFILVLFSFFSNFCYSQYCGFDIQRAQLSQNTSYVAQEKAAEQRIKRALQKRKSAKQSTTVLTIPVVVHVLHLGEAVGVGTNISTTQIQSSIANLNSFYSGQTANSPLDFQIEFTLAKRDPDCGDTSGINRINASAVAGYTANGVALETSSGANETTLKDLSKWPETDYLNIWIVSEIDGNNGGSGIQGYANFYKGNAYEGSVMMYTVFGYDPGNTNGWGLNSNGDNSTVVHEVGHYFHLYHTFQGDDADSGPDYTAQCPTADGTNIGTNSDGCADTVPHKRETSSCPTQNSCTNANWVNNNTINNLMSYYSCPDRMTADQKTRARAAMEGTPIVNSKAALVPDVTYAAPVVVCSQNVTSTNNSGIISVALNGVTFTSFSSASDGGNIDKRANCSNYFEIDALVSNTLNVGVFSVNFQQLGVWIDWNDDGDFEDDAEQQYLANDIAANSVVSIQLSYPTVIPYNDYVTIRLITELDDRYGRALINSACGYTLQNGQSEDYAIHVKTNERIWTGTVNTDWATIGNWDLGLPTVATNATVPIAPGNQPVIGATTGATVNNLTVASGASLKVVSGGSLIVEGTGTGDIRYDLAIPNTNWHLVSSPVVGEQYNDTWVSANSIASGNGSNKGLATYQNGTPDGTTGPWVYLQSNGTGTFGSGLGYSLSKTAVGNYSFIGTFPTTDLVSAISQDNQNWNLLGNPFPSYLDIPAFIAANTAKIAGAFQAIYIWNGTAYTNLTAGYIHPGQAFFVHSGVGTGTVAFTETMQSHQTGVTFYKEGTTTVKLTLSDENNSIETQINYLETKTSGLDPGFDIGLFDGVSSSFSIFTHLVEDNQGISFEKQAVSNSDFETIIIPLGIKAAAGKEIIFSAEALNLPIDIKVFLEDKENTSFTRLDEANATYKVTLTAAANGVGRFYLHTSSKSILGLESTNALNKISMYKVNAATLRIVGLQQGKASVKLYNILGKQMMHSSFTSFGSKDIALPKLVKGIYIIQLETEAGKLKKKIIIE